MFCPTCREEYRTGFDVCADCGVPLVAEPPDPEQENDQHDIELSTVLETSDAALFAVAKSLLEDAKIPFIVRGEYIQDLFGVGRLPGNLNVLVGPVELQVNAQDKDEALTILEDLMNDSLAGDEPTEDKED
jgi:hypothetical protein